MARSASPPRSPLDRAAPAGTVSADPLAATSALADGVFSTLRMARALAESGRRIDLDGLDRLVGLLCARSLDLPPEEGRQMRVSLIAMLEEADALSHSLRDSGPPDAGPPDAGPHGGPAP